MIWFTGVRFQITYVSVEVSLRIGSLSTHSSDSNDQAWAHNFLDLRDNVSARHSTTQSLLLAFTMKESPTQEHTNINAYHKHTSLLFTLERISLRNSTHMALGSFGMAWRCCVSVWERKHNSCCLSWPTNGVFIAQNPPINHQWYSKNLYLFLVHRTSNVQVRCASRPPVY